MTARRALAGLLGLLVLTCGGAPLLGGLTFARGALAAGALVCGVFALAEAAGQRPGSGRETSSAFAAIAAPVAALGALFAGTMWDVPTLTKGLVLVAAAAFVGIAVLAIPVAIRRGRA